MTSPSERMTKMRKRKREQGLTEIQVIVPIAEEYRQKLRDYAKKLCEHYAAQCKK